MAGLFLSRTDIIFKISDMACKGKLYDKVSKVQWYILSSSKHRKFMFYVFM